MTILVPSISASACFDDPLGVLDLVNRVLELLVENTAVGNDGDVGMAAIRSRM